ncbi:MAG: transcriptional regulator [Spirochaetaceae bacterium]|nr:MAG: transcriptional regulator [Spirochaetaceae bacterium]
MTVPPSMVYIVTYEQLFICTYANPNTYEDIVKTVSPGYPVRTMNDSSPGQTAVSAESAQAIAELFRALGDPGRIRIISALVDGRKNVGELAIASELSESAVSHHLRGLRLMRLVRTEKVGRHVYYTMDDDHVFEIFRCGLDHVKHS